MVNLLLVQMHYVSSYQRYTGEMEKFRGIRRRTCLSPGSSDEKFGRRAKAGLQEGVTTTRQIIFDHILSF
jgi:hypothetical protein